MVSSFTVVASVALCFAVSALTAVAVESPLSRQLDAVHSAAIEAVGSDAPSLISILPRRVLHDVRDLGFERYLLKDPAYNWRKGIVATIFWVGEEPRPGNPVGNDKSSWDPYWQQTFGGYDDPDRRDGYLPVGFYPLQSPFYVALPFNDIDPKTGLLREGADDYIPWFWEDYRGPGITVLNGRWIEIKFGHRICYAQWRDVGPFRTDDVDYVFGANRPLPNRNGNAGIDLSPAVRDMLGLRSGQKVDWRFVDVSEVTEGPWASWR